MSPTYGMNTRNMVPTMEECLTELNIKHTYEKAAQLFTLHWTRAKHTKIHLLAAENWRRAAGLNLAFGCVDEMDLIPREDAHDAWRMFQSRLRKGKVFQMAAVSTPEGYAFMHDFFVRDAVNPDGTPKTDRRLIKVSTRDNPYVPDEYIESLLANYPENLIRAYIDGDFVNLTSGPVYYAFDRLLNGTDKTAMDFPLATLQIGVDFNIGNMSAEIACVENGIIHCVDEVTGAYNTEELMNKIQAKYPRRQIMFYPDSSGQQRSSNSSVTDIQIMRRVPNSTVHFNSNNPRIRDRVGAMNAMICNGKKERKLLVNGANCLKLVEGLEQQGYDNGVPDKSSGLDHPLDAIGYFVAFRYPIIGNAILRQVF